MITDRAAGIQNAATLLSNYCGRTGDGPLTPCPHDHTAEAQALVRMVEQHTYPELLRECLDGDAVEVPGLVKAKIEELEQRAAVVPPR